MGATVPLELQRLEDALDAAERDARQLVAGLTEARGAWRSEPGAWSVAECLDHLATANRVYLAAMRPSAERALRNGRRRRGSAQSGLIGGWFVESHDGIRAFLRTYADIDLSGVRFPNPFLRGVRFSLATGLHVLTAHERRHLWQAWRVRKAAERS